MTVENREQQLNPETKIKLQELQQERDLEWIITLYERLPEKEQNEFLRELEEKDPVFKEMMDELKIYFNSQLSKLEQEDSKPHEIPSNTSEINETISETSTPLTWETTTRYLDQNKDFGAFLDCFEEKEIGWEKEVVLTSKVYEWIVRYNANKEPLAKALWQKEIQEAQLELDEKLNLWEILKIEDNNKENQENNIQKNKNCNSWYHLEWWICVKNIKSCYISNGNWEQIWDWEKWNTCNITSCNTWYTNQNWICIKKEETSININVNNQVTTRSCYIDNWQGQETFQNNSWGTCKVVSCNNWYQNENNSCVIKCSIGTHREWSSCVSNIKSCNIENGTWEQTWNWSSFWSCVVKTCNAWYENKNWVCEQRKLNISINNITNYNNKIIVPNWREQPIVKLDLDYNSNQDIILKNMCFNLSNWRIWNITINTLGYKWEYWEQSWFWCIRDIKLQKWNLELFLKPFISRQYLWETFDFEIDKNSIEFLDKETWVVYWINDINYIWSNTFWDFILSNKLYISANHNPSGQWYTIISVFDTNHRELKINKIKLDILSDNIIDWELEIIEDGSNFKKVNINSNTIIVDNLWIQTSNDYSFYLKFRYIPNNSEEKWTLKLKITELEWQIPNSNWGWYNFSTENLKQYSGEIFHNWYIEINY